MNPAKLQATFILPTFVPAFFGEILVSETGRLCDPEALPVLDAPDPRAQARTLGERRLALRGARQVIQQRDDHQISEADALAGHELPLAHQPRELGQAQS